jgi:hypothetical protein
MRLCISWQETEVFWKGYSQKTSKLIYLFKADALSPGTNSSKGRKPFSTLQAAASIQAYSGDFGRLLCFVVRVSQQNEQKKVRQMCIELSPEQKTSALALLKMIKETVTLETLDEGGFEIFADDDQDTDDDDTDADADEDEGEDADENKGEDADAEADENENENENEDKDEDEGSGAKSTAEDIFREVQLDVLDLEEEKEFEEAKQADRHYSGFIQSIPTERLQELLRTIHRVGVSIFTFNGDISHAEGHFSHFDTLGSFTIFSMLEKSGRIGSASHNTPKMTKIKYTGKGIFIHDYFMGDCGNDAK